MQGRENNELNSATEQQTNQEDAPLSSNLRLNFRNIWQRISDIPLISSAETDVAPGITRIDTCVLNIPMATYTYKVDCEQGGDSIYDIGPILSELDKQPEGRASYSIINSLTDGVHLLADTSSVALLTRKHIVRYLSKDDQIHDLCLHYTRLSLGDPTQPITFEPAQMVRNIIFSVLAKLFFNMDQLPAGTDAAMKLFTAEVFESKSPLLHRLGLSFFSKDYRQAKNQYNEFCKQMLDAQIPIIFAYFQSEMLIKAPNNLFIDLIIEKIKAENTQFKKNEDALKKYLQNLDEQEIAHYLDELRTLPSLLMTVDNIAKALIEGIVSHAGQPLMQVIFSEEYYTKFGNIDPGQLTRHDLRSLKYLDGMCIGSVQFLNSSITRYAKEPTTFTNLQDGTRTTLPGGSFLLFRLPNSYMEKTKAFTHLNVFSVDNHSRKCPGERAAVTMFKAILAQFAYGPRRLFINDSLSMVMLKSEPLENTVFRKFAQ